MKGMQGLVVAGILGLLAVVLNWLYLQSKMSGAETISFVGIAQGVTIKPGDQLQDSDLVEVRIPRDNAGDLASFVYTWENKRTVLGIRALRAYEGGELVRFEDYRTPPPELKLAKDERLIWVPVDSKAFVPSLVNPGDEITFFLPASPGNASEMVGPFTVGSLGNRVGSNEVYQAHHIPQAQDRQVGIIVKMDGNQLEQKAQSLLEKVAQRDGRNIGVIYNRKDQR